MRACGLSRNRWAACALLLWTLLFVAALRSSPRQMPEVARNAGGGDGDKDNDEGDGDDGGGLSNYVYAREDALRRGDGVRAPSRRLGLDDLLPLLKEARSAARELLTVADPAAAASAARQVVQSPANDEADAIDILHSELRSIRSHLSTLRRRSPAQAKELVDGAVSVALPSGEREELRRELERGVIDLRHYVSARIRDIDVAAKAGNSDGVAWTLRAVARGYSRRQRAILKDLDLLSVADGVGELKRQEHEQLSDLVQSRIHHLQNPPDCSRARKLVCNLNKNCGLGCQLHHVTYCFMVAYGTGRTLMLLSANWSYAPTGGWQEAFEPLSSTCREDASLASAPVWSGEEATRDVPVVFLPIIDIVSNPPPYVPQAIPEDLAPRLRNLHGHPFVWFVAQFLRYLFRPQKNFANRLLRMQEDIGFEKPVVGVHVRRTDKTLSEAVLHGIDEYMEAVEDYYERLAERQSVPVRRVYLATDEPGVIQEARAKYPNYIFISDLSRAESAGKSQSDRTGDAALFGIIADIHFLSQSDYLVCTMSSQVCRVAYEVMNALHPDASRWYNSLDEWYYFGGQQIPELVAVAASIPELGGEIELQKGDIITYNGNHKNGFMAGTNKRTQKTGVFPTFKAKDKLAIAKFPLYPSVNTTHHKWWFETLRHD